MLAATYPSLPRADWTVLGSATEVSPGQYQFTDLQATNNSQLKNHIRIIAGDAVSLEVSAYDLTKGRITFRHLPGRAPGTTAARPPQRRRR